MGHGANLLFSFSDWTITDGAGFERVVIYLLCEDYTNEPALVNVLGLYAARLTLER